MQFVSSSNGWYFGELGGPNIDLLPLDPRRPLDVSAAYQEATNRIALWQRRAKSPEIFASLPSSWKGVVAVWPTFSLRFIYPPNVRALDALAEIEEYEAPLLSDQRRYELAGFITGIAAACRALDAGGNEHAVADACSTLMKWQSALPREEMHWLRPPLPPRSTKGDPWESAARQLLGRGAPSTRATTAVAGLFRLAEELWTEAGLEGLEQAKREARSQEGGAGLSEQLAWVLASLHEMLYLREGISVAGVRLTGAGYGGEGWPIGGWAAWRVLRRAPAEAVRALYPDGHLHELAALKALEAGGEAEETERWRSLVHPLLEDAKERQAYVPYGGFHLTLPEEVRRFGAQEARLFAEPDGLWMRVFFENNQEWPVRWRPGAEAEHGMEPSPAFDAWLSAVLAGLWRDLVVAGEEAVPERGKRAVATPASARPSGPRKPSARALPTLRRISLSGRREWGTAEERAAIERRAAAVRGHLRRLHSGWKASAEALQIAGEFGVVVPVGATFVRPHVRGGRLEEAGGAVEIRAKGLASLSLLVKEERDGRAQDPA